MINWDYEEALLRMQVGDSFFVPTLAPAALAATIRATARREGLAVICREAVHESALGVRTWRVLASAVDTTPDERDTTP